MDAEERLGLINKPPIEEIVHFDIVNKPPIDELYHYGVLGMKWGIRRYQNPDGTLTEEGKKHYDKQEKRREKKIEREKAYYSRTPEILAKHLDKFTNEEIQKAYTKFEWQDKLSKFNKKESALKRGKKVADDILSVGDTANNGIKFLNTPAGKLLRQKLGLGTEDIANFKSKKQAEKEEMEYRAAVAQAKKNIMLAQQVGITLTNQEMALRQSLQNIGVTFTDSEWEQYKANNYQRR